MEEGLFAITTSPNVDLQNDAHSVDDIILLEDDSNQELQNNDVLQNKELINKELINKNIINKEKTDQN